VNNTGTAFQKNNPTQVHFVQPAKSLKGPLVPLLHPCNPTTVRQDLTPMRRGADNKTIITRIRSTSSNDPMRLLDAPRFPLDPIEQRSSIQTKLLDLLY
jgi:hypothetical protein